MRIKQIKKLFNEFSCWSLKKLFIFCVICFVTMKLLKIFKLLWDEHQAFENGRQKYENTLLTPLIITEQPRFHSERSSSKIKLTLNDIIITIKSTKKYHSDRISILLDTWVKNAINQTFIVTDDQDSSLEKKLAKDHLVATDCGNTHDRLHLCCKTSREYEVSVIKNQSWWCHFDDDVYVQVNNLVSLLNKYDPDKEYIYIGRRSSLKGFPANIRGRSVNIQFHTGAGYCISRSIFPFLYFWMGNGYLTGFCHEIHYADDVCVGALVGNILQIPLTENYLFHSILDQPPPPKLEISKDIKDQVTLMFDEDHPLNFTGFKEVFSKKEDPTGLRSIHCNFYPDDIICPKT